MPKNAVQFAETAALATKIFASFASYRMRYHENTYGYR